MRKFSKVFSVALVGASLFALPSLAHAQKLTLRVEPGVAIPLTDPQALRFGVGGALSVKPEITLGSHLSIGPSLFFMELPSRVNAIKAGTVLGIGGFLRLKRPHDASNEGSGLTAVSPWVDADLLDVSTGPLNRFGWAVAAGAALPTSSDRDLWIGPFVRYQDVYQEDGKANMNTNDAKTLILGLSFEVGARVQKKATPAPCPPPVVVVVVEPTPVEPPAEKPPVVEPDVKVEMKQVIQFAWDSPVLEHAATEQLNAVVKELTTATDLKEIRVEGHASSEGEVKHNDALSLARANSVLEFLAAHGVPREKLSAVGFGSTVPVATNATEAGRVLNRRVEFTVNFVVVKKASKQSTVTKP